MSKMLAAEKKIDSIIPDVQENHIFNTKTTDSKTVHLLT